ncbi:unnamed protein product [Porites lobata]|uniref:Uncharacterized protein n=1 Tax=Porites lobata TaxID=104759 RepID=A0ABN8MY74_9CNID|nr:unnamed protein product [Porites lobata]
MVSVVTESKEKKAVLLTNLPTEKYQLAKDLVVPILVREDSLTYVTNAEHTDRLMSSIRDKRMMSELLKLKLEKLAFDIAVAKYIASEQS